VREVNHPAVRLLYDLYHSMVMGEEPEHVLAGSGHLVGHVHIADVPGRHEPGTGTIDWPRQLAALRSAGYSGAIGLEYIPTRATESSLELIRRLTA
jgi:hydroxypyruvate isomerase